MPRRIKVKQVCPDCGSNLYYSSCFKTYLCRPCNKNVELKEEPKPYMGFRLSEVLSVVRKYRIVDNIQTAIELDVSESVSRKWLNRLASKNQLSRGSAYRYGSSHQIDIFVLKGDEQEYNFKSTEDYEVVFFKGTIVNLG